jgi:hypothetical protein
MRVCVVSTNVVRSGTICSWAMEIAASRCSSARSFSAIARSRSSRTPSTLRLGHTHPKKIATTSRPRTP